MPPSLARKLLIVAAIDGLVLSPLQNARSRSSPPQPSPPVKLEYRTNKITVLTPDKKTLDPSSGVEAHGIVGLLKVSPTSSFLIAITDREQVATIRGRSPVYVITNIVLIPLSSRREALRAIDKANSSKRSLVDAGNESDTEAEIEEEEEGGSVVDDEIQDEIAEAGKAASTTASNEESSIAQDVIRKKGAYGRFAEKWFSRRGWTVDRRRAEGMTEVDTSPSSKTENIMEKPENQPAPPTEGDVASVATDEAAKEDLEGKVEDVAETVKENVAHSLTPKLLHTTKLLLATSRSFYFSYDYDLTRSLASQLNSAGLPLYKTVDPQFFWNHHLQDEFINAGNDGFILPVMEGFVGQKSFSAPSSGPSSPEPNPDNEASESPPSPKVEDFADSSANVPTSDQTCDQTSEKSFILTLISRRTRHRAGLRYLRRGIDDEGHAANGIETEQILNTPSWDHVFSYVQIRASIPVYFSQSPYSLKPRPVLLQSEEANTVAAHTHFKQIREAYGKCHAVSLVEKHGPEAIVGNKYRDMVEKLNSTFASYKIGWTWFDFHKECRGMRFENVSHLFDDIGSVLDDFSYTEELNGKPTGKRQTGVLRTNCMDCLDRTNVVQAGAARRALDMQLATLNITLDDNKMSWFNILWADNGDAISKQYASTAALKGDFTRTRKRNLQGALTDFGLTINRYFNNIISDFFTQAAIDFLLGNVSAQVFVDFEAEMVSSDPAVSMRRVRQNAIEISSKIVVEDETEDLVGGWTFLAPPTSTVNPDLRGALTEVILLLTKDAIYRCEFDWALEKVSAFERVCIEDITSIEWGTYITSTLASSHTDENRNAGFIIRYSVEKKEIVRINTRSLQTSFSKDGSVSNKTGGRWAFKAMPKAHSAVKVGTDEVDVVEKAANERDGVKIVVEQVKAVCDANATRHPEGHGHEVNVEEKDIVSLSEAKKGTGLLEQWGYSLKRFVWT
ncbi:hypothetical protein EX30DRAFT_376478 [Ascodesmis nigricans]|uniref:SAC domain-containing protein n=1 Tax=Ascodesmis nigricans TaxID=341454 RepID=A0A4S2N6L8_9PEZI|nr:hypothetical protein EX30DRAFT_376478 [Ascodesmis nigricans]